MKKSNIIKSLNILSQKDVYSLMLFVLYCLNETDEYSTLSELAYAMDKESLLNVLSLFGGMTIRIPTTSELMTVTEALTVYERCDLSGMTLEDAINDTITPDVNIKELTKAYEKVVEVMKNYDFEPR